MVKKEVEDDQGQLGAQEEDVEDESNEEEIEYDEEEQEEVEIKSSQYDMRETSTSILINQVWWVYWENINLTS